jgi:histone H3/H4
MSVHKLELTRRPVKRIPREAVEMRVDEVRSVEINMMRTLMRRYPEKAKEVAADLFERFVLQKAG